LHVQTPNSTANQPWLRTVWNSGDFLLPYLRPGMRVLDCGCGPGSITAGLASVVAPGQVIGLDASPAQLGVARASAIEAPVDFRLGSVYELPFEDASFDAVFAHSLMTHLRDPAHALREMRRVLVPGGVVGIADDDHGTMVWEPPDPLLLEWHTLWMRIMRAHGADPTRARRHRRALLEAGFVDVIGGAKVGTETRGTLEGVAHFAHALVQQMRQPALVNFALAQGWATRETLEAMVGAAEAWGTNRAAFVGITSFTALGWAPHT
jgi:SAM-dependent methyltransferase